MPVGSQGSGQPKLSLAAAPRSQVPVCRVAGFCCHLMRLLGVVSRSLVGHVLWGCQEACRVGAAEAAALLAVCAGPFEREGVGEVLAEQLCAGQAPPLGAGLWGQCDSSWAGGVRKTVSGGPPLGATPAHRPLSSRAELRRVPVPLPALRRRGRLRQHAGGVRHLPGLPQRGGHVRGPGRPAVGILRFVRALHTGPHGWSHRTRPVWPPPRTCPSQPSGAITGLGYL